MPTARSNTTIATADLRAMKVPMVLPKDLDCHTGGEHTSCAHVRGVAFACREGALPRRRAYVPSPRREGGRLYEDDAPDRAALFRPGIGDLAHHAPGSTGRRSGRHRYR